MTNDLNPAGVDAARAAIKYLSHPETPWSDDQVGAVISAYFASLPQPEGETADLVRRLVHLVSLNEPKNGGPYQGVAAQSCVVAMSEAADAIASLSQRLAVAEADEQVWFERATYEVGAVPHFWEDRAKAAEAQLAHAREAAIEECAKVADAEYNEMARLAAVHRKAGTFESMHRCNAAARSVSRVAAAIRAMKGG